MYKDYLTINSKVATNIRIKEISTKAKTEEELNLELEILINDINQEFNEIATNMFNDIQNKIDKEYKKIKKDDDNYLNYLESIWGKGFKYSTCLYDFSIELLNSYNKILELEHADDLTTNKWRTKLLQLLSNKSLKTFKSILILIKNGMGDDAFNLCRSLHENWVIATFIFQNNEDTAKEFIQSNDNINRRNNYEWARKSGLFRENEHISFNKIYNKCNFDEECSDIWKEQYKKECELLHTTPSGTTKSYCLPQNTSCDFYLVGQSPYGLNIAAEHSAIYLFKTLTLYLDIFNNQWILLNELVLRRILDETQEEYKKVADEICKTNITSDTH